MSDKLAAAPEIMRLRHENAALRAEKEELRAALREILRGKVDEIERDDEGHPDGGFVRPMQMYEAQRIAHDALTSTTEEATS